MEETKIVIGIKGTKQHNESNKKYEVKKVKRVTLKQCFLASGSLVHPYALGISSNNAFYQKLWLIQESHFFNMQDRINYFF